MAGTFRSVIIFILSAIFLSGCSGTSAPVSPQLDTSVHPVTQHTTVSQPADPGDNSHYLWFYSSIYIDASDAENIDFEIIPTRDVTEHWNVLKQLEKGPCSNCVAIKGVVPSGNGTLLVDLEIKHPFSFANLTGFDVRGIAMFAGSHNFPASGLLTSDGSAGEGELVNADGFTALYNPETEGSGPGGLQGYLKGKFASASFPDSTLNGYIRHNSPGAVNTRNAFYAGVSILETYEIDMPSGPFIFGYAVDASWAAPINVPVTNPMTDFPANANCPEAWKIEVTDSPIGQGLTDQGGSTVLTIDVYDWQGKDTILPPTVECQELYDGWKTASWSEDSAGYSRYTVTIENEKIESVGTYTALIAVEDMENSTAPDWLDLTAYQIYKLAVHDFDNSFPVAEGAADPQEQVVCEQIQFSDNGSYDPDGGIITKYEWDWDNDGTYDEEGSEVSHAWDVTGIYLVQLRVTDDEGVTSSLDTPIQVKIVNVLPQAVAYADKYAVEPNEVIHVVGSDSLDYDCGGAEIVNWEWSWTNDGLFDATGEEQWVSYIFEGTYYVQLRVTDDEGGTDLLNFPLAIQVSYDYFDPVPLATASTMTSQVCDPVTFQDDGSYDPDGGFIISYDWDWDNDGTYEDHGPSVSHTWDSPGIYPVGFRVFDDEGASAELDPPLVITVSQGNPVAVATADKLDAFVNEPIEFDGSGSYDTDCDNQEIVTYGWDFDNDMAVDAYGAVVTESFPTKGDKTVNLIVIDDENATATASLVIDVNNGWARTWGGNNTDEATRVVCDSAGNVYVLGNFWMDADFDPGEGVAYHETHDFTKDIYLSKFNENGVFQWVKIWGGPGTDSACGLAIGDSDSVFIAGTFEYTIDLDPGYYMTLATSNGQSDYFLVELNLWGDYEWGISVGGSGKDAIQDIDFNQSSNTLYIAGYYNGTVDFNPYGSVENHTSVGQSDVFLARFASAGAYSWTRTWGSGKEDQAIGVAIDTASNPVVAGIFKLTVDFDAGAGTDERTSNGGYDIFLTKYNNVGTYAWTTAWGGGSDDWVTSATGGSFYNETWVTGSFSGSVDFDPGPGTDNRISNGGEDAFMCGFDFTGLRIFAETWGGSTYDAATSAWYSPTADRVLVTGYFSDLVDLDPSGGTFNVLSNGETDVFLTSFIWNGVFNWVDTWGGMDADRGEIVTVMAGSSEPILVAGAFANLVDFDPQDGIDNHYTNNPPDAFLSRFPEDGLW